MLWVAAATFLVGLSSGLLVPLEVGPTPPAAGPSRLDRSYDAWPDPAAVPTYRLLRMPELACPTLAEVAAHPATEVQPVWIAGAWDEALATENLSRVLLQSLGHELPVRDALHAPTIQDAWAYDAEAAVVAVTNDYYTRHPAGVGHELLGFACGTDAVVSVGPWTGCPLTVFAHEVGHTLGRDHQPDGVMIAPIRCGLEDELRQRPFVDRGEPA